MVFWSPEEIAIDALHHAVYATATGIPYELIAGRSNGDSGYKECISQLTARPGAY